MPRTKKLAHKQTGRKPKVTTTSYRTFQTEADQNRYQQYTSDRTFCAEKGFLLQDTPTMGYEEYVHSVITKHNWKQFCAHPADAVVPVVREFYAHLAGAGQRSVYVRGVQVPIDDYSINQIYELDDAEDLHQEFAARASADWLDQALENVCVPGTTWTVSAQGKLTVPRANLTPQCKVWYHFLKTRLMPSTHVFSVSKARVLLLDSIISGRPIDVGTIIFQSLGTCAAKKCGSLWFPSLITSLCARNGVPMFDTEERLLCSTKAISKVTIARLLNAKMAKDSSQPQGNQENVTGQTPQVPTNSTAEASSSRAPTQDDLTNSLQLLEKRMSLAEVQQYQTMEMLQQMHSQQQQYWEYAKLRDVALKKSLQKNFTKPIFPFPEFPDGVLQPIAAEEVADEVDEEEADTAED